MKLKNPIAYSQFTSVIIFILLLSACNKIMNQPTRVESNESLKTNSTTEDLPSQTAQEITNPLTVLVDPQRPYYVRNEKDEYLSYEAYGSNFTVDKDVEFSIELNIEQIQPVGSNSSTGFNLWGFTENNQVQIFCLIFQNGIWSAGYKTGWETQEYELWESLDTTPSPNKEFVIKIAKKGNSITISDKSGFEKILTLSSSSKYFFENTETVIAYWQVGPFNSLAVSKFSASGLTSENQDQINQTTVKNIALTPANDSETAYVFHVAVTGNDNNPGTEQKPLHSIERARDIIRTINTDMTDDIHVIIHGGTYNLKNPIEFSQIDSGNHGFQITYEAAEGETPVLSGGVVVKNWTEDADSSLWATKLDDIGEFRQLYVDGERATRAVSDKNLTGQQWIKGKFSDHDGIVIKANLLPNISEPSSMEYIGFMIGKICVYQLMIFLIIMMGLKRYG